MAGDEGADGGADLVALVDERPVAGTLEHADVGMREGLALALAGAPAEPASRSGIRISPTRSVLRRTPTV